MNTRTARGSIMLCCCAALFACAARQPAGPGNTMAMLTPPDSLTLLRNAETKDAVLKVGTSSDGGEQPWRLFEQKAPGAVKKLVLEGKGPGTFPLPEARTSWARFLFTRGGTAIPVAERQLPMAGGYDVRDLGGMRGAGGKSVVWGRLFRSDDLKNLTPDDQRYLASIPVRTVVDFRTDKEAGASPDRLPSPRTRYLHCPILPGNIDPAAVAEGRAAGGEAFMTGLYRDLARDEHIAATYRTFFGHVQNAADLPLLFHCSAGKDRTGVAAALILIALGVDRQTVFADYASSNTYLADKYAAEIRANPSQAALYTVNSAYLEAAIAEMEKSHGSVETYLEKVLDVDITAMRTLFLE